MSSLLVGLTTGLLAFAQYQSPEARWQRAHSAARESRVVESSVEKNLDAWRPIHGQLVEYSKRSYPVIVGQTGQWGGASQAGHIVLDLSTLREPRDILAFKLAHEWAHLVLNHSGDPSIQTEDAADQWAGQFLAQYNYDLEAISAYLKNIPYDPTDTIHSPGTKRAMIVVGGE